MGFLPSPHITLCPGSVGLGHPDTDSNSTGLWALCTRAARGQGQIAKQRKPAGPGARGGVGDFEIKQFRWLRAKHMPSAWTWAWRARRARALSPGEPPGARARGPLGVLGAGHVTAGGVWGEAPFLAHSPAAVSRPGLQPGDFPSAGGCWSHVGAQRRNAQQCPLRALSLGGAHLGVPLPVGPGQHPWCQEGGLGEWGKLDGWPHTPLCCQLRRGRRAPPRPVRRHLAVGVAGVGGGSVPGERSPWRAGGVPSALS